MESKQFMVTFSFETALSHKFITLVPKHREKVNELMMDGKILTYSLCIESGLLWAVFEVKNEFELKKIIKTLPLSSFMEFEINQLTFHNSGANFSMSYSLN
ncbi:MAG: hypothetical protein IPL95_13250 [Saprospiraceae bacterium]|jgi:muconolactone delta-isomerase|nr:hypothetical protein [Saprospiraceae bacterium]